MRIFKMMAIVAVILGIVWVVTAPPKKVKVGGIVNFGPVPNSVVKATTEDDYIAKFTKRSGEKLPPYDEVVLNADETLSFIPAIDGWFWRVNLASGDVTRFVEVPLMAAGARLAPDNGNIIYFCSSYLYGEHYPVEERVGLYQLNIKTKVIKPLVLDVPNSPKTGGAPKVYLKANAPNLKQSEMNAGNSRALAFCNDLDVSADGKRIYFTEPFAYGNPSMGGGGTYREAISLGQNGRVWRFDMDTNEVRLIAQNFTFPDGILVENIQGNVEQSLLVTETVKFKLVRMFISGDKAGRFETVLENLPGMPDGMDRDPQGRIWIGMLKQRSATIDKIHQNPWVKHLLLRLPSTWMPVSKSTSVLALSPDGSNPLFYTEHDGSVLTDISVVIPSAAGLFLATVGEGSKGLYHMPYPENLAPPAPPALPTLP